MTLERYDLCLAWSWEHDAAFASLLESACRNLGLRYLQVRPQELEAALQAIKDGLIQISTLLDRAGDADPRFLALGDLIHPETIRILNPTGRTRWAWDKATMHLEFIHAGLVTPHTIVLPPFDQEPGLPAPDLSTLGQGFAIKPASGGGGEGVILEATGWEQVVAARRQFPHQKYLLQARVSPQVLENRPAWFRVLYCAGGVFPCWWDPHTHAYTRLDAAERYRFRLSGLSPACRRIAALCQLDLFSTEIALTADGTLVAVDYVNDPVDLRLQSQAGDGVPDAIVAAIAGRIARLAAT